jgi:transcription factor IIIB subunit 2
MWCTNCRENVEAEVDEANGFTCCQNCGKVLDDSVFSSDPTFLKTATGASQVEGNFVPESGIAPTLTRGPRGAVTLSFQSQDSHEKTLNRGRSEINELADRLSIRPREDIAAAAHRLYKLAVQRNFTRGRRTQQVAAACLYTICRQEQKPYMLIDFSDCIQANVYLLGAVFLQLIQLLRLESHPIISRPIDPSLYIHRFADRMNFGKSMHNVANTALRLVSSMKRDWMQTGRRPAGICGAALFIASHMHGFRRKKKDIVSVVHVCEATIKKRLGEFECTPSADLTSSEFEKWGVQYEKEQSAILNSANQGAGVLSISNGAKADLAEIVQLCGGFSGGQDPPSFQRNVQAMVAKAQAKNPQLEYSLSNKNEAEEIELELDKAFGQKKVQELVLKPFVSNDNFDEIDDDEIDQYLHTSDESKVKDKLWRQMNAEFLLSQPQPEQLEAGTSGTGAEEGKRKRRRDRSSKEEKYSADTASEATHKMLSSKRLSSKINYNKLKELFAEGDDGKKGSAEQTEGADPNAKATGSGEKGSGSGKGGSRFNIGTLGYGMPLGPTLGKKVRFS